MITTLGRAIKNEKEYDMSDYLASGRAIAMQNIQIYQQLLGKDQRDTLTLKAPPFELKLKKGLT